MTNMFLIKYGEIGIKGRNRGVFEDALVKQIRIALDAVDGEFFTRKERGRIYVNCSGDWNYDETVNALTHVFGIVGIAPVVECDCDTYETLEKNVLEYMKNEHGNETATFKVKVRRVDWENNRFTFSLKDLAKDPWQEYCEDFSAGSWVTGRVVRREPAAPRGIPGEYVMRPFDVKLSYMGKPWCTVPLEVGFDEIGDAEQADVTSQEEASYALERLGFPAVGDVALMDLCYQVAQKLHGLTSGGDRVRDLVDLQLIAGNADVDPARTRRVCVRLFAYRKAQEWPPRVVAGEGWGELYATQAEGLDVLQDLGEAIEWANGLVTRIDAAR